MISCRTVRFHLALTGDSPEVPLYEGDLDRDIQFVSRKRMAEKIVGGFSYPSKMPCPAWGIPARRCRIGSVLAQQEGTTCHNCYALKNLFRMGQVQRAYERRYQGLLNVLWTPAMIAMCRWYCDDYMRLFDSGDLQGINHLKNICTIAANVRDVLFWLPTREYEVVKACKDEVPENLVVRLSAHQVDGRPPRWPTTSTVVTDANEATCPAPHGFHYEKGARGSREVAHRDGEKQ